ncbi:MAG: hypothetical protein GZ094_13950 [Mariniphaga sp.]|nr:hypothetical protein [Mariniphaga sp.]
MTILDLIGLDLKKFLENEFEITYEGKNSEGKNYIDYEKSISPKILNIFDKIQIKIFADKFEISERNFLSVMLFASKGKASTNEIRNVTVTLHQAFGKDSDGKRMWSNQDIQNLNIGIFNRNWDLSPNGETINDITDDSYAVRIGYNCRNMSTVYTEPEYFSMSIWRINKILNKPVEKINIPISNSGSSKKKSEGCFIATACYGDYDADEVIVLRKYRDDVLCKSIFGFFFIKIYYAVSPAFAKIILQSDFLRRNIRQILLRPLIFQIENKISKDL